MHFSDTHCTMQYNIIDFNSRREHIVRFPLMSIAHTSMLYDLTKWLRLYLQMILVVYITDKYDNLVKVIRLLIHFSYRVNGHLNWINYEYKYLFIWDQIYIIPNLLCFVVMLRFYLFIFSIVWAPYFSCSLSIFPFKMECSKKGWAV